MNLRDTLLRMLGKPVGVEATFEQYGGSSAMLGHPGRLRIWTELNADGNTTEVDACCPGCGQAFFNLPPGQHRLYGDPEHPSLLGLVGPTVCCGWTGHLVEGYWVGK